MAQRESHIWLGSPSRLFSNPSRTHLISALHLRVRLWASFGISSLAQLLLEPTKLVHNEGFLLAFRTVSQKYCSLFPTTRAWSVSLYDRHVVIMISVSIITLCVHLQPSPYIHKPLFLNHIVIIIKFLTVGLVLSIAPVFAQTDSITFDSRCANTIA